MLLVIEHHRLLPSRSACLPARLGPLIALPLFWVIWVLLLLVVVVLVVVVLCWHKTAAAGIKPE